MKSVSDAYSRIDQLKAEIGANGWAGMAWACLRLNPKYQTAVERVRAGRLRSRDVCAEFGVRKVKDCSQGFAEDFIPEFRPVRVVRPCDEKAADSTLSMRQNTVRFKPTQIAIVISLDQDIGIQLLLAEAALDRAKTRLDDRAKPMRNLRPFAVMVDLVVRALVAFELSVQGWGPSKIGAVLFAEKKPSAAKTSARDLVQRGTRYVRHGYLRFAMQTSIENRPRQPKKHLAEKSAAPSEQKEAPPAAKPKPLFEIITPLPPLHKYRY